MVRIIESSRQFYQQALDGIGQIGIPVSTNYSAENLGFLRRVDEIKNTYLEGSLMGPIESVLLTTNESYSLYLDIFSTVAASPHTLFALPYNIFDPKWRASMDVYKTTHNIPHIDGDYPLVRGAGSQDDSIVPPEFIPLHLLSWCFLRKVDHETKEESFENVDFDDLAGIQFKEKKNYSKLADRYNIPNNDFIKGVGDTFDILKRRNNLQADVIVELYNENILPALNDALMNVPEHLRRFIKNVFQPLTRAEIATYFSSGYYRDANMNGFDGLGGGPQSNQGLHWHALRLPDFMELAYVLGHAKGTVVTTKTQALVTELAEYLSAAVPQAKGILSYLDKSEVAIDLFVKQADYYSTAFFKLFHDWVDQEISESLSAYQGNVGSNFAIEQFTSHSDKHDVEARFAEGWKITVPEGTFPDMLIALRPFFQTMHNMWIDTQETLKNFALTMDETLFDNIAQKYHLNEEIVQAIKTLRPTQKQLTHWLGQEANNERMNKARARVDKVMERARKRKDVARMAELFTLQGLFNPTDQSDKSSFYNIPGVPSFGITYTRDEKNQLVVYIGPLLSLKGLAEQYSGAVLKRDTGVRS